MTTAQQAGAAVRIRATCPTCGKVCRIASAGSPAAGLFLQHRPQGAAKGWCASGGTRVRARDLVHGCKRCQALPVLPALPGGYEALEHLPADGDPEKYRPATPRPVKARGYCASHLREVVAAERERGRDQYRERNYGLTPARFRELVDAQDGTCACGSTHARSRTAKTAQLALAVDHHHGRQAECVAAGRHGPETCCEHCVRGALGRRCNTEIVGRFTADQLRNLADYMDHPTAELLGWWDETERTETMADPTKADAHCPDCDEIVDPRLPDQVAGCGQTPQDQVR